MMNRPQILALLKSCRRSLFLGAVSLAALPALAQYDYFNIASGSDCIMQDYRSANVPSGIYDAIHQDYATSSDGGSGYFYGGFTHQNNVNGTPMSLVQYVCWPASGGYPFSYSQQIPFFAGTNMVGYPQIGEGSSCAIKGFWPQFTSTLWTREVVRYWLPADGTPHVGYQGMWIKEPVSGNWYHVTTFKYPFAITGVTGIGGWQENFSGYTGDYIVDHANGYYHKSGSWQMANQIQYTAHGDVYLINNNTATESACGPDYTSLYNVTPSSSVTLTVSGQPALPTFDPIVVSNATASVMSTQLLVQWQMPLSSSPQLSYLVEVFNNSSYTGSAAVSFTDNDPEARQKLLNISGVATPYVRLTIADIFFQTNTPILITPATAAPSPATSVSGTVNGLNYQYYDTSSTTWTTLPNFSSLTPVFQGAVPFTDVTPRRQRVNYGFNYLGYLNAPAAGLYAFTLHSGDGSTLTIDGSTVIAFDGLHDSSQSMGGGIALAAGAHTFNVQFFKGAANPVNSTAYTDGLGLAWEGPGIAKADVPASAYSRVPTSGEPAITMASPASNATVLNSSPGLSASVTNNGATVNSVRFYLTDYSSYYFRPSAGVDYCVGQDSSLPFTYNSMIWTAPTNLVRARLVYNGTNTIDSAPVSMVTTNSSFGAWYWTPLEMHDYPSGASLQGNTFTMVGDGMNMLSRRVTGDCTLIARLASITPNVPGPDGIYPDGSGRAGIILRGTTNTTIGQPLGDGGTTRFAALFSSVGGGTYFENDTMRGGNGDANSWSGNLGGGNKWYKLQRTGDSFTSSVSMDGVNWTIVNVTNLPSFGSTIYAGVFIHVLQSMNSNVHLASLDSFSLTGTNVVGPASIAVSPPTNAVVGGLPATFTTTVVGPVPASYQWQLNGTNLAGANSASYTIASANAGNAGSYTVVANNTTSAPALLLISAPAGSGVWTNLNGGSWGMSNNWSGGLAAGGLDAVADFSTLNLSLAPTVTLDGARTNGTLVFNDLNPSVAHNWTVATGSGGPLTLAASSGTPGVGVNSATNIISAVLAGTQGFTKTGPGYLTLSGASTITGTINVSAGTVEMQSKSGDTPYTVAAGATLKIGYSTGGGYASTAMTIVGNGVADPSGFYLAGGKTYNASGQIALTASPTTLHQYGSGYANFGTFDINGTGLWCTAAASGSASDTNVQMVSDGYGMSVQIDAGTNTAAGDFTINGPLNVTSLGFYKRGAGSLVLNGVATSANTAVKLQAGIVVCGTNNCLGANASVPVSSGASLQLNGFNQAIGSLNVASGANLNFGGPSTLAVATPPVLAGTIQMVLAKGGAVSNSALVVTSGTLTNGGALVINSVGTNAFAVGDSFTLFSAPSYAGNFSSLSLPALPVGLLWNTAGLSTNGTLVILTNTGSSAWNGGGTNGNWSTAGNWNGTLPVNGQFLTFQGTTQPLNTNDLLASAGQAIFANGGFALAGTPVTLLWGLVNQAGTNTWAIGTTLAAAQTFASSNGTLIVSGPVTNGGFTLTLDGPGTNLLLGALSGPGGLVKNGSGLATLNGANTFSGVANINAGLLRLSTNAAFGSSATVTNAGTLDLNGRDFTASMFNHPVTIGGQGTGVTVLTNSSAARAQLQDVVLSSNATIAMASSSTLFVGGTNAQNGILNLNGFTLTLGGGTLVLNGVNMSAPGNITVNAGTLQLMDTYGNNQQATTLAGSGNLTVNAGATVTTSKWGPTLTLTMPVVLNGGTLSSTWPGPDGATFACPILVNSNSTINFNGGGYGNATLSGNITGGGGLTVTGDGDTRTFTGNNSYGWTTISAGTMQIGNGSTGGSLGLGSVTNNATLTFNCPGTLVVSNKIAGSGPLVQTGSGTTFLFSTNLFTGGVTLAGGTLNVSAPETPGTSGPLGKSGAILFSGGTLQFSPVDTYDYSSRFSKATNQAISLDTGGQNVTLAAALVSTNGGSLTKLGLGTLTLAATNTYNGPTTVVAGTLLVNGLLSTNTVTVATNATLGGVGVMGGLVTVQSGGILAPGSGGIGRLTISNNLALAGNALMKISKLGGGLTNDLVSVTGTLTMGGSLAVTNIGTNALAAGDKFMLFSAGAQAGNFSALTLPALSAGLGWSNSLAANGSLQVVTTVSLAWTNLVFSVSGGTLFLSWPADHTGWRLLVQTNHLAAGLSANPSDWGTVSGSAATNNVRVLLDPAQPAAFYQLAYP